MSLVPPYPQEVAFCIHCQSQDDFQLAHLQALLQLLRRPQVFLLVRIHVNAQDAFHFQMREIA